MTYLFVTLGFLAATVFLNCLRLWLQYHQRLGRFGRFLIIPLWALFMLLLLQLDANSRIGLFEHGLMKVAGLLIILGAVFVSNTKPAGSRLRDLVYNRFWLVLVGAGLYTANAAFWVVAAVAYIGLNQIQARVQQLA